MAKKTKPDMPPEVWLRVATDALARYAAAGEIVRVAPAVTDEGAPAVIIILPIDTDDPRISPAFAELLDRVDA